MAEKMAQAIDGFYPYFWHKFKISPRNYTEEPQCEKWVKDLREAVFVHGIVSLWQWRPFLDHILLKNRFSFKTYTSYTFFIISTTVEDSTRHESFMTSCSLVTAIAAYVHDKGHHDFLEYCPDILMVIFEEKYLKKPDGIQVWEKLEDHLNKYNYTEALKMVEQTIKGNPFADEVYKLEFVAKIKEKIGSKIPIGNAAVYRQMAKVEKRFRARKLQNLSFIEDWERRISVGEESTSVVKESKSSFQTENVKEPEEVQENEQRFSEVKEKIDIKLKQISLEQGLQNDANTIVSHSQSHVGHRIPVITSHCSTPRLMKLLTENVEKPYENEQSLSAAKENDDVNSKKVSLQSEQTLRNDTNMLIIPDSEESPVVHPIPVVTSKRYSPFQMKTCQNVEDKMSENIQSLSVAKENVDMNSKQIPSLQSEQMLQNDWNALLVVHSEENPAVHRIPVKTSNRSYSFQRETCQNVEDKMPENIQSLSVAKENVDMNSKQIPSLQSEQMLQNDWNALLVVHSEENPAVHRIPVKTSNRSSSFQRKTCRNVEDKMPENIQSLSVAKENVDMNSKQIPSLQSEQMLQNDWNALLVEHSEENPAVHRIPVKTSNRSSSFQRETCRNVEETKIPENVQSLSVAKEQDDINTKQISLRPEETVQNDWNALLKLHSEENPAVHRIPVITSIRSSSFQMEPSCQNEGKPDIPEIESLSVAETDINSKQISLQLEQTPPNKNILMSDSEDSDTLIMSDSEIPGARPIPVLTSNRNSPLQMQPSFQNVEEAKITENLQSLSVGKDNDDTDPAEMSSLQSEQTLQNDANTTLIMPDSEESSVVYPIPVITSNRISPFQMESCQNVEEAKIPENVQSLSVMEEHEDEKQRSSFVSEQLLLNDREKLGISDKEQNTPVESSIKNLNSGGESSRLETAISTEGNYSDIPDDSGATSQNVKQLLNERECLETSEKKRSTPVKSSVDNLNLGDESSQLETEIATEGSYSDMPCDPKATDQNWKQLLNDGEKLEPSNSKEITSVKLSLEKLQLGDENSQLETVNAKEKFSDVARDSETTDQDTAQQSHGKRKKKNKKSKPKKVTKTSLNLSPSKLEGNKVAESKSPSHPEKQPLQVIEEPVDTEESLPVPSTDDVLRTCLFLEGKFKDSFRSVCDLLRIHISI